MILFNNTANSASATDSARPRTSRAPEPVLNGAEESVPESPISKGEINELNKKWTYFGSEMTLNSFAINKTTSKPWSNLVKFSAKRGVFSPKTTQNRPELHPFSTPFIGSLLTCHRG
jgi:hypothetical protein